jgi:outer membrane protein OmpA-like peptidoglycan-associated protein
MSRLRIVIPLCLSSLTVPAFGEQAATFCHPSSWTSSRCQAERAHAFAARRNAEVAASLAAYYVARGRLASNMSYCQTADWSTPRCEDERAYELALARSHCKTSDDSSPRCTAERARNFAAERNAEINASLAAVREARRLALSMTHCKTPDSTTPRCEAERAREFAAERNAEINASLAAVAAVRARQFAAARNAEINASIAAVEAEHERQFAAARNAEIDASLAAVAFVRQRNAEIDASIAAVKAEHERQFAAARNAEIDTSLAVAEFVRQRNAEINASIAAAEAERSRRNAGMDTGAIPLPESSTQGLRGTLRHTRYSDPCREAGRPVSPLQFSNGNASIEEWMKPQLDHLAEIARACPAVRIEIDGHTDASAPVQVNRNLAERRAQATLAYLVDSGIDPKRLAAVGHGAREPRVIGTASSYRNDRVEFKIDDPAMNTVAARIMVDLAELLDPSYASSTVARLSP